MLLGHYFSNILVISDLQWAYEAWPHGHQSRWKPGSPGLKTGGVMDPGLKTEGLWVLKIQQMEAHSTGLRVSYLEFLFNYIQIYLFLKNHHFWKIWGS